LPAAARHGDCRPRTEPFSGDPMSSAPGADRHRIPVLAQWRQDHQRLGAAWREHARARGQEDGAAARQLMLRALAEWRVLAALEQEVLMPATATALGPEIAARAEVAYEPMQALVAALQQSPVDGAKAAARFDELGALLQQHAALVEDEIVPRLESAELDWAALAGTLAQRRQTLAEEQLRPDAGGLDDARPKHPEPEREAPSFRRERPATGITPSGAAGGRRISD
jgi:hypothetical protein